MMIAQWSSFPVFVPNISVSFNYVLPILKQTNHKFCFGTELTYEISKYFTYVLSLKVL